jgi:hypothetical protein
MNFDASRVESLLRALGDPRYAGPDGEANVADFVSGQFTEMGLDVQRRQVTGSRFPRRAAPWVAWLGYGFLVSSVYGLALAANGLRLVLACVLAYFAAAWFEAVVKNLVRPGPWRPPLETAPVLVASRRGRPPASMRVVLQSLISGVNPDPFLSCFRGPNQRKILFYFLYLFPPAWASLFLIFRACAPPGGRRDLLIVSELLAHNVYPAFLAAAWIVILTVLFRAYGQRRSMAGRDRPDRRGIALLLEMARTWPRTGSRPFEPVFVLAGGQPLDYAGSREVVRLLRSEWSSVSSLLILFFAPGAGDELWLSTSPWSARGLAEVAEDAARSLWIPYRPDRSGVLYSFWPHENLFSVLALIGSDPRALDDESVDPKGLQRAAQLATEVALRWAKVVQQERKDLGLPGSAG